MYALKTPVRLRWLIVCVAAFQARCVARFGFAQVSRRAASDGGARPLWREDSLDIPAATTGGSLREYRTFRAGCLPRTDPRRMPDRYTPCHEGCAAMTGWWILICGCTCVTGVLIFLGLVAHGVQRIEVVMFTFQRSEERAAKRRKKRRAAEAARRAQEEADASGDASTDEEPFVAEVATGVDRVAAELPRG